MGPRAALPLACGACAAALGLLAVRSSQAHAQPLPGRLALQWQAPAGCPSEADARAALERLLARPEEALPALTAQVRVRARGHRWRVEVALPRTSPGRSRVIYGDTCAAVVDAAVLIVALAVDPDAAVPAPGQGATAPTAATPAPSTPSTAPVTGSSSAGSPATPSLTPGSTTEGAPSGPVGPSPTTPAATPVTPTAPTTIPATPTSTPTTTPTTTPVPPTAPTTPGRLPWPLRVRWSARLGAQTDVGALPAVTVAPWLTFGMALGVFRVELSASYWVPREAQVGVGADGLPRGGTLDLVTGAVTVCVVPWGARRWDAGLCGGLEVGSQRGRAFGVAQPSSGEALWLAGALLGRVRGDLGGRFGLSATAGALVPALRPEFVIDGLGTVFRTSPIGFRAAVGAEVYF